MPRTKKKKPGTGMSKQFETIICISQMGLLFLIWILRTFYQSTDFEIILIYFIGTALVIIVLRSINKSAADKAMDVLPRSNSFH